MAIYNLEESPNIFITIDDYDDKFLYRMLEVIGEKRKKIRSIDLRNDKLKIHGAEIEESMATRLYDSLTLKDRQGLICVNCDGACYFVLQNGGRYMPIHNVIFDWSPFGVVVPNSVNDGLRKQLDDKDKKIDHLNNQLALAETDVSKFKEERRSIEVELQKVQAKLSCVNTELQSTKIELETVSTKVKQMEQEISCLTQENQDIKMKMRRAENELESSNKNAQNLEEQLSNCKYECQEMETKSENMKDQVGMVNRELEHTKTLLEDSRKEVEELKGQICCHEKEEQQRREIELQKMVDQLQAINLEVKSVNQKLDQQYSNLWTKLNGYELPCEEFNISTHNVQIVQEVPNTRNNLPSGTLLENNSDEPDIGVEINT